MAKTKESDWLEKLAKLAKASVSTDGFLSRVEIQTRLGVKEDVTRKLLGLAKSVGKLQTRRTTREGIDGLQHPVVLYKVM